MLSFRTEIENPVVEKDIIDLEKKIKQFHDGKIDDEKFRSLRLARGVYGQRQPGVQMIRIKLPYGKVTSKQLERIADVSDEYSTGKMHFTTRQDVQIHYVSLDRTPELWADLEKDNITLREACGNTVRNITASDLAGVDPNEPFDITPYAHAMFEYLLRNPVGQDMGRKFKISFSSSEDDTAFSFMHDLGFIAKEKDGVRGFKVMLGGGLGSQPAHAHLVYDFLPANKIIPFAEGAIRVFDRHGERARRMKARLKFLIKEIGIDTFLKLIEEEALAVANPTYEIAIPEEKDYHSAISKPNQSSIINDEKAFRVWKTTNTIAQKQEGFYAVKVRVPNGNISTKTARALANIIKIAAVDDARISINQGLVLRFFKKDLLPYVYNKLNELDLAKPGFDSIHDITSCPGTDTCNLGIASSTGIATALEEALANEYADLVYNTDIKIKISGCMNSCGQHGLAHIGFQGMTIKSGDKVAPALQILLGGGVDKDGKGRYADKVIKVPSKRGVESLRVLLNDYAKKGNGDLFNTYYDRQGKIYFYDLLKHLGETQNLTPQEYIDWGYNEEYVKEIGVGECAGVTIDLVGTLLLESKEKLEFARDSFDNGAYADGIYHAYTSYINAAKALLTFKGLTCNTHAAIIELFQKEFVESKELDMGDFSKLTYGIKENKPSKDFAAEYISNLESFLDKLDKYREKSSEHAVV